MSDPSSPSSRPQNSDQYAYLKAEAIAPYRGLRQFVYLVCGGSGAIGGFVFLTQVMAGRDVEAALPNLGLQLGVTALMIWLFRREQRVAKRQRHP
ncbi:hypothetical protein DO97_13975 [Neosynechococcus sphagnicola sy1]|uniref:DUF3493 domain-containing protein n=1 Tax=Neosynechococcus sphagnicola sy1 TaxID=1497020 RepID=A0A098TIX7_9CYAN|nr:DUF3493 domain-containing protein [Neosynechococcus sphagnicola]KGF71996.1 hypothetical protein DO97_13975 [Neosynechococcus sphagnicola sy1]